jgi:hypothetical protein
MSFKRIAHDVSWHGQDRKLKFKVQMYSSKHVVPPNFESVAGASRESVGTVLQVTDIEQSCRISVVAYNLVL